VTSSASGTPSIATPATDIKVRRRRSALSGGRWSTLLWVAPALAVYGTFVLYPLAKTLQYSLYNWDGIGPATYTGLSNYQDVFTDPQLFSSIVHSLILIIFFTLIPLCLGLLSAVLLRELKTRGVGGALRALLFLPQVMPLAGSAIAWQWMYSPTGVVNQFLRAVGLGGLQQDWLGDFSTALPAVGVIGTWVATGFCTILLLVGIGRIDISLYEAARLDGAGRWREFRSVTLPDLRREIAVCMTVCTISALASFDVIYVATQGGPGYNTMVPGLEIFQLTFLNQEVGQASALAVVLVALVLVIILPIQFLGRTDDHR
jgi:raffinose/stachyose/melibiose transport system permease protein